MTPQLTLAIDLETYSSVDIKKSGMYKYIESPDFEIILIGYAFNSQVAQVIDPLDFDLLPLLTDPNVLKTAHNAPFEIACLEKHFGITLDPSQWECTMAKGAQVGLPLSLDEMSKALGLDTKKDAKGKALIKYFCCPCKPTKANGMRTRNLPHHDPEKWEAFVEYCRQDVVVEQAIRERISFFEFPEREKRIWLLDQKINRRGILLDPVLIENAIAIDRTHADRLTAEAAALTGLDNPNSVAQLKEWLGTDEPLNKETMPALLKNAPDETTRRVLEIRQQLGKASIKKFTAMTNAACADSRVRGLHQYYGAWRTGRWAGRIVQPQNLAKNYLPDLDLARDLVRQGALDDVELCFGNVGDTLSQLIRTAFIADVGKHLAVCDFSAIEARVIAWLAGERWRLDVFNGHGKIYEASAAQMFKVPLETIDKGRENHHLRAKGKIAELALGYQGSVGALEKMGAVKMGLSKDELKPLVDMWRNANKQIVKLWYDADKAAIEAVDTLERVNLHHGVSFQVRSDVLFITLPSGRRLAYQQPRIQPGKFGDVVTYMGQDQITKKWTRMESYGGKWVENCLAEGTPVITDNGIKPIEQVTEDDLVWDGIEWVEHSGLIYKGNRYAFNVNGIYLTYEHKILTTEGWQATSQIQGHSGYAVALPDGYELRRIGWFKIYLERFLRLRQDRADACDGVFKTENKVMRLYRKTTDRREKSDTRTVKPSAVLGMAEHESALHESKRSSVAQLRRPRYFGLREMARIVRELLCGRVSRLRVGAEHRADRRERQLHSGKRPLDTAKYATSKQTRDALGGNALGQNVRFGSGTESGDKTIYASLPNSQRLSAGALVRRSGLYKPVYDLLNCGPRIRFTVMTATGPLIVHNCVQAIARDILAESLLSLDTAGFDIVMHVHDEVIAEGTQSAEAMGEIMGQPIPWAAGLPLRADGYETKYYCKKD